ncbi:type II toxin-antitoxin system CcdA family antitoxin [Sphingomonas silueang]|uniref:type II toxin-antitoxin system CcdA family antitoxin n=1 Tax=Sphingomonas silueang TaxID=3156617 RepID=UPI0032B52E9E
MGAEGRIDPAMIADAESLGIDVVAACEAGLAQAIRRVREAEWLAQNREAIEAWNSWTETNELPLADLRRF